MAASPPSSGGRRSWRQTPRGSQAAPSGVGRWFLTVTGVLLLAAFFGGLWWSRSFTYDTHLLALHPGDHDRLVTPPVAYAFEDSQALANLDPKSFVARRLESPASLDDWLQRAGGNRDVAIVYVNTHGFTAEGKPLLFCDQQNQGRTRISGCALEELVQRLAASSAARKLLVLDCGRLSSDPRFGMVANEFPRLVEEELQKLDGGKQKDQEDDLYVLLACSTFETTVVSHARQRSLFSLALEEGLQGGANDGDDPHVSLAELFEYLQKQLRFADGASWTPTLLSRSGLVRVEDEATRKRLAEWFVCRPKQFAASRDESAEDSEGKTAPESGPESGKAKQQAARESGGFGAGNLPGGPTSVAFQAPSAGTPAPQPSAADEVPKEDVAQPGKGAAASPPAANPTPSDSEKKDPDKEPGKETDKDPAKAKGAGSEKADSAGAAAVPGPAPAAPTTSVPEAPDTEGPKRPKNLLAIQKLWKLRDTLHNRNAGGWSPVDFAPHAWREVNAYLLDAEARCRAGQIYDTQELSTDLQELLELLTELSEAMAADRDAGRPGSTSVAARLQLAWNSYRKSAAAEAFRSSPSSRNVLRGYWDLMFLAPELPAWYAATLEDQLPAQILDGLTRIQIPGEEPDPSTLAGLDQRLSVLRGLRDNLVEPARLNQLLGIGAEGQIGPNALRSLEGVLSVSFVPAETRSRILEHLLDAPTPKFASSGKVASRPGDISPKQWQQVQRYCELQFAAVRLLSTPALEVKRWDAPQPFRAQAAADAGARIEEVFDDAVPAARKPGRSEEVRKLGILVDPRDALSLEKAVGQTEQLFLSPPAARRKVDRLEVVSLKELVRIQDQPQLRDVTVLELDTGSWRTCEITVRSDLNAPADVKCRLEADRGLSVRRKDDERTLGTGWFPVRMHALGGGAAEGTLTIEVQANRELDVGGEDQARLRIYLQAGTVETDAPYELRCELPTSHAIDVVASRVDADVLAPEPIEWRLRPFANRRTDFQLALRRRSGKAQKVQLELYAAARHPRADWKPGRLFQGTGRELLPGVLDANAPGMQRLPLARSAEQVLSPGNELTPLTWLPPAAAAPVAAGAPAAAGAPPAAAVSTPAEYNITHGLMCVIRVLEPPGSPPLVRWLEIDPLLPGDFFDGELEVDSLPLALRLTLRLQDVNSDQQVRRIADVPGGLAEKPLTINWETRRSKGLAAAAHAPIESPLKIDEQALELRDLRWPFSAALGVQQPESSWQSFVAIDDCPRALAFEFANGQWQRLQSPRRALITGVAVSDTSYQHATESQAGDEKKEEGSKGRVLPLVGSKQDAPLVFAKPKQPGARLRLQFEIDAPVDAFLGNQPNADAIELFFDDNEQVKRTYYFDRDVKTTLHQPGPWLSISSRVGDFEIDEPISSINTVTKVTVRLRWKGNFEALDHCWFLVDDQPPEITVSAPREVEQGQTLAVQVRGSDKSGISDDVQLELVFDKNGSGEWEEALEPPIPFKRKQADRPLGPSPARFELPTKELPPGTYFVRSQMHDRVGLASGWDERHVTIKPPPVPTKKKKPVLTLPPAPVEPPPASQPKTNK